MRTIDGHFTIINEPGTARDLAARLLGMFESVREPEHIIITPALLEQAAIRAQKVRAQSLEQSLKKIDAEIEACDDLSQHTTYDNVDKAQAKVLELTACAERNSTKKNWRKLDSAHKKLAKQLEKSGFASYTAYADFLNAQVVGGAARRELFLTRDDVIAEKKKVENEANSVTNLSPAQIITVLADVLSRAPHTPVGPLPIVLDDTLRHLETSTKLRALEVLKAHASYYATWYVTDDPLVLGWAGFKEVPASPNSSGVFDVDIAS